MVLKTISEYKERNTQVMTIKEYYSIGEVAKICNVNIRTLHYYDEIGLLTPEQIDPKSRYRNYSYQQIVEVMLIKEFKFFGFSLKEVKSLLKRDDIEFNRKMLKHKCAEIDKTMQSLALLKERLEKQVIAIEQRYHEANNEEEINIKNIKEEYIAYIDCQCACTIDNFNKIYVELFTKIEQSGLEVMGDRFAIFKDIDSIDYNNAHVRLFSPVKATAEICGFVEYMPSYHAVSMMYYGAYDYLDHAYDRMYQYIKDNNIAAKKSIINHLIINPGTSKEQEEFITEILIKIEKLTQSSGI